jgi:hypothetical protein
VLRTRPHYQQPKTMNRTRLWIELTGSSILLCTGLIIGVNVADRGILPHLLFGAATATATATAIGANRHRWDESPKLQNEIDDLKSTVAKLKNLLSLEQGNAKTTAETLHNALSDLANAQTHISSLETSLTASKAKLRELEGLNSKAGVEIVKQRNLVNQLKAQMVATVANLKETHSQAIASLEKEHRDDLDTFKYEYARKAGRKIDEIHGKRYAKALNVARSEDRQTIERLTNRVTELNRDIETLQGQLDEFAAANQAYEQLLEQTRSQDLPEIRRTFEHEWSSHDDLLQRRVQVLQAENVALNQPDKPLGESSAARRVSKIVDYFFDQRIKLDWRFWRKGETTDKVFFHYGDYQNQPNILGELNDPTNINWIRLNLGLQSEPKFTYEPEEMMITISLHHSIRAVSIKDVERLWIDKEEFLRRAAKWSRVRVTGGSEAGKSPTAENIAAVILAERPGKCLLANPQSDSVKNYWSIEPTYKTHTESFEGMKALASEVTLRSEGNASKDEFRLYLFDETDSTMKQHQTASNYLLTAVKQVSHQNLGMILTGQNANVKEYKGLDRSDLENMVSVHIGSNAHHAIVNSNNFTTEQTTKLQDKLNKLIEFCENQNRLNGLDFTDPKAYRVAMVVEPNKEPWFAELPFFGSRRIADVLELKPSPRKDRADSAPISANVAANGGLEPSIKPLEPSLAMGCANSAATAANLTIGGLAAVAASLKPKCPHCRSENLKKNKTQPSGKVQYKCKDCGKFTTI